MKKQLLLILSCLWLGIMAKAQCVPPGYEPLPSTASLVVNSTFATQTGTTPTPGISSNPATTVGTDYTASIGFWSQAGRTANNAYANQGLGGYRNVFALQTGSITPGSWFGTDNANQFPGDPANNVAAVPTWFYSNGNFFGGQEYLLWGQNVTGLTINRDYTFYCYVNNIIEPPANAPDDPIVRMRIGGNVGLPDGTVVAGPITLTEVLTATTQPLGGWIRVQYCFKALATNLILKLTSSATGGNGDDFALTQFGVVSYRPILNAASNTPICQGATVNLTAATPAIGTFTYSWTGPNGFTSSAQNPSRTSLTSLDYGDYIVTITDAVGVTNTRTVTVTERTTGCFTITGSVFHDPNANNTNDGGEAVINGTNTGGGVMAGAVLYVNLLSANGLTVIASAPVMANGTYTFSNFTSNTSYVLQLTTNQGTANMAAPATQLPGTWLNTGENKSGQGQRIIHPMALSL